MRWNVSLKIVVLLSIGEATVLAHAQDTNFLSATSLCYQGEVEYFSCEIQEKRKIASVCAAKNISPDNGYVQYRFGTHVKIDYQFPEKMIPPRGKISIVDVSRLPDGLGSHIKFSNGEFSYVVSNALVPGEVYVVKNGKIIFDGICQGNAYMPFDSAARWGLEYGVVDSVDGLDRHGELTHEKKR